MVAIVSFLAFREPPILSDQLDYFSAAWALPDVSPTHRHLRVGLIWPVWLLTRIFGYSEFAYYGIPLLTRFLLGFATWWLGRQMFSARVGWAAGLLIMMTPGYTRVASQLLPDYFAGSLIALGVALIFWARSGAPRSMRWQLLALLASGICVGWAYLAREYIVILFPCIGLGLLLLRTPLKGWVAFCSGAVAT
ncbi:MAG: glycosyltransferase family 39 protein, partial [Xanthomonadales bacterium]|nr:glycosyltransferase family 39 protein [Xanthomonadales bacterium]